MLSPVISIRAATKNDSFIIAELSSQLGYPSTILQIQKRLEVILDHPENIVLIACIEEKVVGWMHVFIQTHLESDTFAEIGGLVTDEKYRGKGIGKRLVAEAEKWAQQKGFTKLRVRSNAIRNDAHGFYLDLEYIEVKEQKVFDKKLI